MGNGAGTGVAAAINTASADDLKVTLSNLDKAGRDKVRAALEENGASWNKPQGGSPKQVCICGGGNAAHVFSALTPVLLANCKVHILTRESERWIESLKENGCITIEKTEPDESTKTIKGTPALVTNDAAKAVPGSNVVFLPLPAFAHQGYIEAIAPFIEPGAVIVGMPGYPGFMWMIKKVLGPKADNIQVVGSDTLPWVARLTSYGVSAEVIGTKSQMLGCCTDPASLAGPQACIGSFPVLQHGSGIAADLMTTNPYIHLSIMYAKWSKWDGQPLDEKPLFYHGVDQFAAETMTKVNDELVLKVRDVLKAKRPDLNLDRVVSVHQWYIDCYESQTEDTSSLQSCLNTNSAYRGLTHPCKQTVEGKFVPDFNYRYMTEDLPMGLVPLRAIAHIAGIETPMTDEVLLWCSAAIGKEYLKDGQLNGKDIMETRAPINFGIDSIEQMLW